MADKKVSLNRAGLTIGIVSAILHTLWAIGIGLGLSGVWIKGLHFLDIQTSLTAFNLGTAIIGIIGAFISGYVIGWVLAAIWNWSSRFK